MVLRLFWSVSFLKKLNLPSSLFENVAQKMAPEGAIGRFARTFRAVVLNQTSLLKNLFNLWQNGFIINR